MDHHDARNLVTEQNTEAILGHLCSDNANDRKIMARELISRSKLLHDIRLWTFIAPALVQSLVSKDMEVLEASTRWLAQLATKAWPSVAEHCQKQDGQTALLAILRHKHQNIRSAAVQALVATAYHTDNMGLIDPLLTHPSPRMRAALASAVARCLEANLPVYDLLPKVLAMVPNAHKRVLKSIEHLIRVLSKKGRATVAYQHSLQTVHDQLSVLNDASLCELLTGIEARMASPVSSVTVDALFTQLNAGCAHDHENALSGLRTLFDARVVTPEEVSKHLACAYGHPSPSVRAELGKIVSEAQSTNKRPFTLLEHRDDAVRRGAQTVYAESQAMQAALAKVKAKAPRTAEENGVEIAPEKRVSESVQGLLGTLFDQDMRELWGWGRHFETTPRTERGPLALNTVGSIYCGALKVGSFALSYINVDLRTKRVICVAIDQKTPQDREWVLHPGAGWWQQACECMEWPVSARSNWF